MKDMPAFTTGAGVASLILREIPYSKRAYITIQYAADIQELLKECTDFCHAVGAEDIYATGDPYLATYPEYTELVEMSYRRSKLPATEALAVELSEAKSSDFRNLYNQKMRSVPTAASLTIQDTQRLIEQGNGYFVVLNGVEIGIGIVGDDTIDMLAALMPGRGADVLCALSKYLKSETVHVTVATANIKAMTLYNRLGFTVSKILEKWYKIF